MDFNLEPIHLIDTKVKYNEPISKYSYLGVGGNVKCFCEIGSVLDLSNIIYYAKENKLKYKVIGNGSNILFSDKGYDGIIIKLSLNKIEINNSLVHCTSDIKLSSLIDFLIDNNLCGLEELCGIPATVGGAIYMNASAFNREISRYIKSVVIFYHGKLKTLTKKECEFSYRESIFSKKDYVIVSADFSFPMGNRKDVILECKNRRQLTQPIGKNCGSIFKNPKGKYAGKIIEDCNLKGTKIGNVSISKKHANFLQIDGKCTAQDIFNLIEYVKNEVYKKTKILLQQEVEYLGDF